MKLKYNEMDLKILYFTVKNNFCVYQVFLLNLMLKSCFYPSLLKTNQNYEIIFFNRKSSLDKKFQYFKRLNLALKH